MIIVFHIIQPIFKTSECKELTQRNTILFHKPGFSQQSILFNLFAKFVWYMTVYATDYHHPIYCDFLVKRKIWT